MAESPPAAPPIWSAVALRRKYGGFLWGSAFLDRFYNQTGWPLTELVIGFARGLPAGGVVLDAGAGPMVHRDAFNHCRYEACDVGGYGAVEGLYSKDTTQPFFESDLLSIPRPDGHYDGIISTSVLEHVPDPRKVVAEMARVLSPTGVLLLSTSGLYGLHMEPWHFYNTTPYSLLQLTHDAGLRVLYLAPRGGWFNMVGGTLGKVVDINLKRARKTWLRPLLSPITHVTVPMLCAALDRFDKLKQFSVGWDVIAVRRDGGEQRFDAAHLPARMRFPRYQPEALAKRYPSVQAMLDTPSRSDAREPLSSGHEDS
jgi:SAM-dependent methyltransferase